MNTYISILRGINVSGKNIIRMEELRALYRSIGLHNVQSYIQSGNLVFNSESTDEQQIEASIRQAIKRELGLEVPVIVRSLESFQRTLGSNPFIKGKSHPHEKLYFTFLSLVPQAKNLESLSENKFLPDQYIVQGRDIFLFIAEKYGQTKLSNTYFEKRLNVRATSRNWKTTHKLLEMASEIDAGK